MDGSKVIRPNMLFLAILGAFCPILGPFLAPRGPTRVFPEKSFGQSLSFIGTYMCAKNQKNLMDGCSENPERTDGRS